MFVVLAVLSFLAGFFLLGLAWLSGHRTIIPTVIKPLWFWAPGLMFMSVTPVFGLMPSVLMWNQCATECSLDVPEQRLAYDTCVSSSRATIAGEAGKDENRTEAQIQAIVDGQATAIEAQCESSITTLCTSKCFNNWWDPRIVEAEAPE